MPKYAKVTCEFDSLGHNDLRQTMKFDDTVKEYLGNSRGAGSSRTREKKAILEKRAITNKIESCFLNFFCKPNTKSTLTSCQGQFGMGSEMYKTSVLFSLFG